MLDRFLIPDLIGMLWPYALAVLVLWGVLSMVGAIANYRDGRV